MAAILFGKWSCDLNVTSSDCRYYATLVVWRNQEWHVLHVNSEWNWVATGGTMTSDAINWYLLDSRDESRVSSSRCTSFARVVEFDSRSRFVIEILHQAYHRTSVFKSREKAALIMVTLALRLSVWLPGVAMRFSQSKHLDRQWMHHLINELYVLSPGCEGQKWHQQHQETQNVIVWRVFKVSLFSNY